MREIVASWTCQHVQVKIGRACRKGKQKRASHIGANPEELI